MLFSNKTLRRAREPRTIRNNNATIAAALLSGCDSESESLRGNCGYATILQVYTLREWRGEEIFPHLLMGTILPPVRTLRHPVWTNIREVSAE